MPDYAVRITHSYEVAKKVVNEWAMKCGKLLAYEHEGEVTGKAHIHLLLQGTSVDKKQLRNIAAATGLPVKGNEHMSFKVWDGQMAYVAYMSKGKHDPKYNKGFADDVIEAAKSSWVPPHQHVKTDNTDAVLNAFDTYVFESDFDVNNLDYWDLKTMAKKFVFATSGYQRARWDIKTNNKYNMLMMTYIYEHKIDVPITEKKWKW